MFSKIDKKVIIILIAVLIIIIISGFLVYKYASGPLASEKNSSIGAPTEQKTDTGVNTITATPPVQVEMGGVQAQGDNGGGVISVCLDKCGDGICQKTDPNCGKKNLNCICLETPQECPQDCK